MNKKQYNALDRTDADVQARLKNIPEGGIITTKSEFEALRKKHPLIPDWLWTQIRSKGIDEDHVEDIKKDMSERYGRGDPMPQEAPITVYDIGGLYGIPKGIPTLIASDGGHRMRAIRDLGWQNVSVYEIEPPKNKYQAGSTQLWGNAHGVIAKSNDIETFQTNFADLMKDEREGKDIGTWDSDEFDSEIYKLMPTFEDTMRNGTDRDRRAMKRAMKKALIADWPMHKEDASKLLKNCIQYENSAVSYNAEVQKNLELLDLGKFSNRVGLRHDKDGKVSEVVVSTQNADNMKDAFAKLEDFHMETLLGENEQELSPNVEFSIIFGYKYKQEDLGKSAAGVVSSQRSKAVRILNRKLAYRGDTLKFKFGKLYFPDQIRNTESKTLEVAINTKGLLPATKKGVYDSKNLENPQFTYKGW